MTSVCGLFYFCLRVLGKPMKSNNPNTELQVDLVVIDGGRKPVHYCVYLDFQTPLESQINQPVFRPREGAKNVLGITPLWSRI